MKYALALTLILTVSVATAQSPYSDIQSRRVKALSEQQIGDLEAGRGMGLALAAELNGYPGPLHVLELSQQLDLSAEQRQRLETLFAAMKSEAQPLGARLIAQERALDAAFAGKSITPQALKDATMAIAATQGALRETHLKYHLTTAEILTPAQTRRYAELRGYGSAAAGHQHRRH